MITVLNRSSLLYPVLFMLLLVRCGGGGGSSQQPPPGSNQNPIPIISSLSPSNGTAGGNAFTLTVTGSGFIASSKVRWNSADRTTTFGSGTQLQAAIPASDIQNAGTAQITVFNSTPGVGTSNGQTFTISPAGNVPQISSINPPATIAGRSGITIAVFGVNFTSSSVVRWNGSDRTTTFVSNSQLRAAIPTSDIASKGTAQVTVFNPAPGGGSSGAITFTATAFGGLVSFTFQSVVAPWVDAGPMAKGNFDSDGVTDLAVTDSFPLSVHLGLGNGTGGFSFGSINLQAKNVIAADFNGDGHQDLAFTTLPLGFALDEVALFLGDGQGNFSQSWQYGYPLNSPCRQQILGGLGAIVEADVNKDGKMDLVVGHAGFSVFLGNGDGTFAQPTNFGCNPAVDSESTTIAAADFNRDGGIDLAIVDRLQSRLTVWLNDGSGTFSALPPLSGFFLGSLVTADFDLDGNVDVAAKAAPTTANIYFGAGNGGFSALVQVTSSVMDPFGFTESVLSAADLNGDSIPDLTMSGPSDQNIFPGTDTAVDVFLSKGNRTFSLTGEAAFFGGAGGIAAFDVDGNGRVDVLLGGNGTLWEMLNQ